MHPLLLRALAVANPTVRELLEMQYQFDEPFIVDSTTFTARLGLRSTPLRDSRGEDLGTTYRSPSMNR